MSDLSYSRLLKRGSTYYFRAKVPVDLLDHYAPKTEIKFSLKTRDRRDAVRLVHLESVRLDEEFQRIRQLRDATPITEFTQQEARSIANAWLSELLDLDEFRRKSGMSGDFADMYEEGLALMDEEGREALATGNTSTIDRPLQHFLERNGYKVAPKSSAHRDLAYEFAKAAVRATELMQARHRGTVIDTPEPPPLPSRPVAGQLPAEGPEGSLSELIKQWRKERNPTDKTWAEFDLAVRRFIALHTDLAIRQIKKAHVVQFKDRLLEDGKAAGTITKQIGALYTVLQYAVDNDKLEFNPAAGVKVAQAKHDKEKRLPYELADLKLIFNSPVFKSGERPNAGAGEAAFWLPLLALYTGARLEELGQAHVADVKEEDDVLYLEISDRHGDKRVKTKTSRRRIPLHQELLLCGFKHYVDGLRDDKQTQLFPELKADHMGKLTGNWSKWWSRYARALGIKDKRKVFHSFRHSFKDACRECGIEEAIHDALTGHSGGGVGRSYGGHMYPLPPLVAAMEKLRYKSLDLGHLQPATRSPGDARAAQSNRPQSRPQNDGVSS